MLAYGTPLCKSKEPFVAAIVQPAFEGGSWLVLRIQQRRLYASRDYGGKSQWYELYRIYTSTVYRTLKAKSYENAAGQMGGTVVFAGVPNSEFVITLN